ncbi:HAD family hydrolase [Desulfobacterales bacterium HSG2]|nr:HAD family hydrolase [Desulfobacterales bacterium HSG2]
MEVFLDIGFTLMGGPKDSPPKMIRHVLNLEDDCSEVLYDIVFCENHQTSDSLVNSLEKAFGLRINSDQRREIANFWQMQYVSAYELEGASAFIKNLARSGLGLHIVSNLWLPFYQKFKIVFREIFNMLSSETLSFEEGIRKPSLEIYRRASDRSGALLAESVMVGDSVGNDIIPCAELGMKCIWFKSRPMEKHQLDSKRYLISRYIDIYEANSLGEAQAIIERILLK